MRSAVLWLSAWEEGNDSVSEDDEINEERPVFSSQQL
ncbi:hypothetical protein MEA186_06453 [Mesorhizobium amorphae CCNWGS0123]|uniref:Uncharacterized protein n=1 Tax=Mesorhizobium amorphae CCNWGS0123 TaxID=1082933 RepID=G6Y5T1_9HYPH|nr:hypothetical protein MEA186_06453 [Mesorhizobium amorphae CCNWGS0123]